MSIGIKQLCGEYLNSKDEGSDKFRRLLRMAQLEGVREFNMDIQGQFQTVQIDVSSNHTIPYPSDYLDWSMVGIVNANGEAVPMDLNESLVSLKQSFIAGQGLTDVPNIGDTQFTFGNGMPLPNVFLNYSWGGNFLNLYGVGGGVGTIGSFKPDPRAKCFLVDACFQYSSVLLEYLTDGYDCECGDHQIHTFATTAFIAWLRWKDNIDKKGVSDSKVLSLQRAYGIEKQKAKYRLNQAKIREMVAVQRQNIKLAAKA